MDAVAARGYLILTSEASRLFPATADAGTRLLLLSIRYLRFAIGNPELFSTMFRGRLSALPNNVGQLSFVPYIAAVNDAIDDDLLPNEDRATVALAVWSALHGITVACLSGGYLGLGISSRPEHLVTSMFALYFPQLRTSWSQMQLEHEP
ncbi:TetR-like C-terminal domain-containing protein [Glaciihabitans sp. UYNi722]|uniref:TetR-like C-terminal domain-containing protein n=1 Tax=Glaciihabitans sp. UYNi722 TaxID=3156344 RepID=UPI003394FFC3